MMKNAAAWLLLLFVFSCSPDSREFNPGKEVLLYSYFKGNGDGLHLAYSTDGYRWKALKNDKILLKPRVGQDKLMRDPCIIRGADNKFHMVWTVSWNERGLGYASSTDLVNWSKQQYVPVTSADGEKWTDISKRISFPKGMRHGTIFKVSQEEFARLQQ